MTPSIGFGHLSLALNEWGARDKKEFAEQHETSELILVLQSYHLPLALNEWGAGDNKRDCCKAALTLRTFMTPA